MRISYGRVSTRDQMPHFEFVDRIWKFFCGLWGTWETGTVEKVRGAIVLRLAPQPTGPWDAPITVATYKEYPTLYDGFLHPDSNGLDVYSTMTQYDTTATTSR